MINKCMFKPTYLYIKTHNKTGLKYFGKSCGRRFKQYRGSGIRWLNHINYHGYDVTTEIFGYYTDREECRQAALAFSKEHDIVHSPEWANLVVEDGISGGTGLPKNKNSQFGTMWITNESSNSKILRSSPIPEGWRRGRIVPKGWGENLSKKLKGRTLEDLMGKEKASIGLEMRKRQRLKSKTGFGSK